MSFLESIENQNEGIVTLAKHVFATVGETSNVVFSPASINIVLSFIAASNSSDATKEKILSILDASSTDELNSVAAQILSVVLRDNSVNGGPVISAANGVWFDKSLIVDSSFKELLTTSYKSSFNSVDFRTKGEVTKEVNSWVKKETKGLIRELLSPNYVPDLTDVIFANALYFNGRWDKKFGASLTKEEDFHLLDGTIVRVPFMTDSRSRNICVHDGFKVLNLSYREGRSDDKHYFSMSIYLPDEKDGLSTMLDTLGSDPDILNGYVKGEWSKAGKLKVPKFNFSCDFEASKALKGMGLDLSMQKIFHKCRVEVDEEGTKAVVATAATALLGMAACGPAPRRVDFVADHPFLFVVKEHKSHLVLFLGQVLDPSSITN